MKINSFEKEFHTNSSNKKLYNALIMSCQRSGATIFKTECHEFYPVGMTAFIVLGESHAALHYFPEDEVVWVQISTCSSIIDVDMFFSKFKKMIE